MTSNPIRLSRLLAPCLLLSGAPLHAEDAALRNLLRDALYTEEVNRDPDKAALQYEELLSKLDEQRAFAATALFRLAEVRRKQGRKEEAIQLYQRLIREFPAAGPELKLATENLGALGAEVPEAGTPVSDDETKELLRLQTLANTGPDLLRSPENMNEAAKKGWLKVISFLIAQGQDPYKTAALSGATHFGYLSVCKALLEAKGNPPPAIADEALQAAVTRKRHEILKLYLKSGFDVNRPMVLPKSLSCFPEDWDQGITGMLIAAGANLDAMPAKTNIQSSDNKGNAGTALHESLSFGNVAAANYLLDKGCKPDLATPDHNISPLHLAAYSASKEMATMVKRLLDAGADPNRESRASAVSVSEAIWNTATPLELAVRAGNKASIEHLIAAGANANRQDALGEALKLNDPDVLEMLLKAGLTPAAFPMSHAATLDDDTVFGHLADRKNLDPRIFGLLVKHGAKPSEAWLGRRFFGASAEMYRLLNREFIYSSLAAEPAITAIFGGVNIDKVQTELARQQGGSEPPSFASFYNKIHETLASQGGNRIVPMKARIVRHKEGGGFQEIPLDVGSDAPLPGLQWGDIIEFPQQSPDQPGNRSSSYESYWKYRSKLAVPISVEIAGQKKDYLLDGKRLVFDVTSNRLPLSTAGEVADLLWPTPLTRSQLPGGGVVISVARKDWPLLRLNYQSNEARNLQLQAGDELKIEIPAEVETAIAEARKKGVTVRAPGFPYLTYFNSTPNTEGAVPAAPMIPTLSQLLAEIYGGDAAVDPAYFSAGDDNALGAIRSDDSDSLRRFAVLPFPDFGAIHILRLREDGSEEEIQVDWSKAIETIADHSKPEEARKADIPLKAGDIVELRVRKDRPEGEWKGFSPKEELLLAKMMAGQFQLSEKDGQITLQQLNYKAPLYRETEGGWLPTMPPGGTSSMKASAIVKIPAGPGQPSSYDGVNVSRGELQFNYLPRLSVFLRNGDVLDTSGWGYRPRPRQPVQPPQPGQPSSPSR